jgi:hypothetical protein
MFTGGRAREEDATIGGHARGGRLGDRRAAAGATPRRAAGDGGRGPVRHGKLGVPREGVKSAAHVRTGCSEVGAS